jgi:hypothetical protein
VIFFILTGCSEFDKDNSTTPLSTNELTGNLQESGFRLYFDIGTVLVVQYQVSSDRCIKTRTFPREEFPDALSWILTDIASIGFMAYKGNYSEAVFSVEKKNILPASCDTFLGDYSANDTG